MVVRSVIDDAHPRFRIHLDGAKWLPAGEYELEWRRFPMPPHHNLLLIHTLDGSPPFRASINVEGVNIAKTHAVIRNNSECEGIADMLTRAGIIQPDPKPFRLGMNMEVFAKVLRWE